MKNLKIQAYFIMIFLFNLMYNVLPFFCVKKAFLRLFGITLGNKSYIHVPVKLFSLHNLRVGNNSVIAPYCYLDTRRGISIGNNVSISHNTRIYTLGHDLNTPELHLVGTPVTIDDDAFIYANVLIMPGVHIGKGAVVYPGSVVVKDVAPYAIVGGNPARVLGERSKLELTKANYGFWFAQ